MPRRGVKATPIGIATAADKALMGKRITGLEFRIVDGGSTLIKAIGLEGGLTLQLGIGGDKQALYIAKEEADASGD